VALQFEDGRIFCGRYAENAAFNPSLPPMQMACAHAVLGGEDLATVRRAVLLESKDGQISQRDSAQSTLKALGSVELSTKPF
jgi:cytidine deaminase